MGKNAVRSTRIALIAALLLLTSACSTATPSSTTDAEATTTTATSTTTVPITTSSPPVTTPTTTSTVPPTTSTTTAVNHPPDIVSGLIVSIGGGSGEVIAEWDRSLEADVDHYNLWYSPTSNAGKELLAAVPDDPNVIPPPAYDAGGGRTAYVDFPRDQDEGTQCYQVSAVDTAGGEGQRSPEICLPLIPPGEVAGFSVGIGGGSGEVFVAWTRLVGGSIDHYNLWYSELSADTKTLLADVAHAPGSLTSPAYDAGGGVTTYIDFPRDLVNGTQCYQISAVGTNGTEGPRTAESCLSGLGG